MNPPEKAACQGWGASLVRGYKETVREQDLRVGRRQGLVEQVSQKPLTFVKERASANISCKRSMTMPELERLVPSTSNPPPTSPDLERDTGRTGRR